MVIFYFFFPSQNAIFPPLYRSLLVHGSLGYRNQEVWISFQVGICVPMIPFDLSLSFLLEKPSLVERFSLIDVYTKRAVMSRRILCGMREQSSSPFLRD